MLIAPRSLLLALVALVFPALAKAAFQPGYSIQMFQTEQGLPHNNVNAIIQSREGYLWLGAFGGLVRFDGVRFKVFDAANTPQLQNSRITALFEDDEGTIWIGHETGDVTRLRGNHFEPVAIPGAPRREPVQAITTGANGVAMVFYLSASLRNVKTGEMAAEMAMDQQRGFAACARDQSGALWILQAGSLTRVADGKAQLVEFDHFAADQFVYGIGAARDGGVWIAGSRSIRKRNGDRWTREVFIPWRPTVLTAMHEMRNGTIAVATVDQGIYLMRANAADHLDRNDGLPPDWVRSLCEDREGNLWVGLGSGGMVALRPARAAAIQPSDRADRWKGRPVASVGSTRNGAVWIGTEGAGLYRFANGICAPFVAEQGPPTNSFVWSFAEESSGKLWISAADHGLFVLEGGRFREPAGLESFTSPVRALLDSPSRGGMLLGARAGLFRFAEGTLGALATNLVAPDIRCMVEQTNGVIWFGMYGGGLGRLENGTAKQFRKADGVASDFVQALHLEADGTLWIGTAESGLTRLKEGVFRSITTSNGLRDNVICHIADDGLGYFWISSGGGIMRVAKEDLDRCADGEISSFQCLAYGQTDGLPSEQCSGGLQPAGCRLVDGSLLFATLKGIAAIDPAGVRTNQLPTILIEDLRVSDARVETSGARRTEIPPGRQRFDFDYTAISFAAPEGVLFKYRLDGLEQDWIGPTAKRTISYSHLEPGDYTFRVIACNSDGAWNETAATLGFTVLPFFWQTLWFRATVISAAFGLVGLAVLFVTRQRYRRRLELAERQRGIERERARIAQDIHDDLGSSLTRIILLSQSARGDLGSPELAAGDLDRIYDTARNLTRSLDEIVWAVNPRHDTLDSLATYLGKFAQDYLGAADLRCRLDLPVSLPSWPLTAETRHNVFLAFKEALNNTVKHARATEVRVVLALGGSGFLLTIEDDGRGFDTSAKNSDTEDGLRNMRKRLTDIGGNCEIQSELGKGTRVRFHVPIQQGSTAG